MKWLKKKLQQLAQVARDEERRKAFEAGPKGPSMPPERRAKMKVMGLQPYYAVNGKPHVRIAFGDETGAQPREGQVCEVCGARLGEMHLPSCAKEQCPSCGGTAFLCGCKYG